MKFLCTDCQREHGIRDEDAEACRRETIRLQATDEGRAQLRDMYRARLKATAEASGTAAARANEAWLHAVKAGCPDNAITTLRGRHMDTPALEAAKRFCTIGKDLLTFLTLLGPPGIGKSVAATHVVVEFCRTWPWNDGPTGTTLVPVIWARAAEVAALSEFHEHDREHLKALGNARLLVLEDAGDEGTDFGKGHVVNLLMLRHERKRRTVLCSNVKGPAFVARYGEAVLDRLRTSGTIPDLQSQKSMRQRRPA